MEYFNRYTSNTIAGSGNQFFFSTDQAECTGRIFYKIHAGGEYNYSLLFSNIIDSTFAAGDKCQRNIVCDEWEILRVRVGVCRECYMDKMVDVVLYPLTFNGKTHKAVLPGEFFCTDEIKLKIESGEYLCVEITYKGDMIPYHHETLLPCFVKENDQWVPSNHIPFPGMIGCDRVIKKKVAFWGDSITQGIGAPDNSYLHWNARLIELLGEEHAYWNLGLGCARLDDATTFGAWYFKAKQADVVFVCFGVNDILNGYTSDVMKNNLNQLVDRLQETGIQVILQTIPPFNYNDQDKKTWSDVNEFIKTELQKKCQIFDCVSILGDLKSGKHIARYGGHPNVDGCLAWAKALYKKIAGEI